MIRSCSRQYIRSIAFLGIALSISSSNLFCQGGANREWLLFLGIGDGQKGSLTAYPRTSKCGFGKSYIEISYSDVAIWSRSGESIVQSENAFTNFRTPPGVKITHLEKKKGREDIILWQLSDGSVYEMFFDTTDCSWSAKNIGKIGQYGSESWEKVIGDDLYSLSSSFVRVSRDTSRTWQIDTTGLDGGIASDLALDTLQYVYATTEGYSGNLGLFRQHPDSSVWRKVISFPGISLHTVFVDRRNRIYVGSNNNGVYTSTDNGTGWLRDTAGMGNVQITNFTDDLFGNVYALNGGGVFGGPLYRSIGGTEPWARIDGGLMAMAGPDIVIKDISGDTALTAATNFGLFASSDGGTTWKDRSNWLPTVDFSGILRHPSGRILIAAARGIFYRNPGDTSWMRTYPQGRYQSGLELIADGLGNLYTSYAPTSFSFVYLVSTDEGGTWGLDTAGIPPNSRGPFFVDETGTRHLQAYFPSKSYAYAPYYKTRGGPWTIDTAGIVMNDYGQVGSFSSDGKGWLYMAGQTPAVAKRPISGGVWTPDTTGLAGVSVLIDLMPDRDGNMVGRYFRTIYHQGAGSWHVVPKPSVLSTNSSSTAFSIDSSGALFAAYTDGFPAMPKGVFFSTDWGSHWTFAGGDSVLVTRLVSYGDTTYALTSGNGIFIFTRTPATTVEEGRKVLQTFALNQNYPNPFNPSTSISYQIPVISRITLKVYDILGRELATVASGIETLGQHQVTWNADRYASGVYFYRLEVTPLEGGKSFVATKKLVLLK